MILAQTINLLEPTEITTAFVLLIGILLFMFLVIALWLRHAIIFTLWSLTVILFVLTFLINLSFIYFWLGVLVLLLSASVAGIYRFYLIPSSLR